MKRAREEENGAGAIIDQENVLDETDFDRIRGEMKKYDEQREKIIKSSRDVQKSSKQAIFGLHRKDNKGASAKLSFALEAATALLPLIENEPTLRYGSYANALEEYAEAKIFEHYLATGKLLPSSSPLLEVGGAPLKNEEYLGGVLDFTGELNRFAVQRATARDEDQVRRCRDLVESIMDQYLKFDFRNGGIRKKYDALKYTLKNMENMLYELSLTHNGLKTNVRKNEGPPEAATKAE
jgi:predicted translin family RNA/ssDNA-binding protein